MPARGALPHRPGPPRAATSGDSTGPPGQGRDFAHGFDPDTYLTVFGSFPTANVFFDPGLASPTTREFTLSAGTELGRDGWARLTYSRRSVTNFVEDFVDLTTGETTVSRSVRVLSIYDIAELRDPGLAGTRGTGAGPRQPALPTPSILSAIQFIGSVHQITESICRRASAHPRGAGLQVTDI